MSPARCLHERISRCFPRVSGDEPPTGLIDLIESVFSPRERG